MKKVFFAAVAVLALASCKKEWTCECEVMGMKVSAKTEKMSKADAKAECEDGSDGMCTLK